MLNKTCLFILLLFVSMTAFESLEISSSNIVEKSSKLHKNVSNLLSKVKSRSHFKNIKVLIKFIKSLMAKMVKYQKMHASVYSQIKLQVKDEITFRKEEMKDAKLSFDNALKAQKYFLKLTKKGDNLIKALKAAIKSMKEKLEQTKKSQGKSQKDLKQRKQFVNDAIGFLKKFEGKISGSQKQLSVINTTFLELDSSKINPYIMSLLQLDKAATSKQIFEKLVSSLSLLKSKLSADVQALKKLLSDSSVSQMNYNADMLKAIEVLEKNLTRIKKHNLKMQQAVKNEKRISNMAEKKYSRNEKLIENAREMGESFRKEFVDATKNRLEEIQTIKEVLEIVNKRIATIPKDIREDLINMQYHFGQYINLTKYNPYPAFKRTSLKDNSHGRSLANKVSLD